MLRPIGSHPAAVYWRRRLLVAGSAVVLIVLIVLTFQALTSNGRSPSQAAPQGSSPAANQTPAAGTTTSSSSPTTSGSATSSDSSTAGRATTGGSVSSSASPPGPCSAAQLDVAAQVGAASYSVGQQPVLELRVTNTAAAPCVQDLADSQVLLRVYNGESRVWGSHDCKTLPGTNDRTLAAHQTVDISLSWTGLSSQPNCAGVRQRVGAGTYTLYAALAGRTGRAAQFALR